MRRFHGSGHLYVKSTMLCMRTRICCALNAGQFSITQNVRADSRITHIEGEALMIPGAGRLPTT